MKIYEHRDEGKRNQLTKTESLLISIWSRILKINSIDINDNFFLLGGNSLKAMQIISEVEHVFFIRLPFILIFKYNTINKLARYIEKNKPKKNKQHNKIKNPIKKNEFPLTDFQKSLYFICQSQGARAFIYNVPLVLEIVGSLDYSILSKSMTFLIERHDILRTIFYGSDERLVQKIIDKGCNDIILTPEFIRHDEISKKVIFEINQYIPLDRFPLLRVKLLKLSRTEHILVIVQPHVITDGWSLKIIKEELFHCYSAMIENRSPKLESIETPYFKYVSNTQNNNCLLDIDYWKLKLEGVQDINFPYDYARPKAINFFGRKYPFAIKAEIFSRLNSFSSQHNVTPFIVIATILNILLSRYCCQEDISVGFPISGRNESLLNQTVGLFVNTLVLRNKISLDKTFIELLEQVKKSCFEAYTHQGVPFNKLVNELKIDRKFGVNPIFQVMLVWQDWYEKEIHPTQGMIVRSKFIDQQTAKFDLTFELMPTESSLEGFIEYNTELFDIKTIESVIYNFVNLIEQCIFIPDIPIEEISLRYPAKIRAEITKKIDFLPYKVEMPRQLFEINAKKTPSRLAVVYKDRYLTYSDLNNRANQLAHYIQSKYFHVEKGKKFPVIGIFLDKCMDVIISILAILKLGVAYVPIDRRSSENRIDFIISDSHCKIIITKSIYKDIFKFSDLALVFLDQEKSLIDAHPSNNLSFVNKPNDLMYIIYTSGTTGQPKGVMQTHFNVSRLFYTTNRVFNFSTTDTWLFFHSHAFDFSVWEIWGAFFYGGQLIIPDEIDIMDPSRLYQLMKKHKVTILNQTPSAFQGLIQEFKNHSSNELMLRYIIFGGESLNIKILSDWWVQHTDTHPVMVNMYGITETTIHTTYKILSKINFNRRENSNIGVPLDDMSAVIVDKNMKPVSIGLPGELLIGGNGLSTGYLNKPKINKQKFITIHINGDEDTNKILSESYRFYRTGDLVRLLSDGSLEYLGRMDRQIKFKGFRIEVEEIELALRRFHNIDQCIVSEKKYGNTKKLVAYYTLKKSKNEEPKHQVLHSFLKQTLPSYMIPNLFMRIEKIPFTENMKINYTKLPEIDNYVTDIKSDSKKPETISQKTLALIFEKNLNIKNIGLDDDFFGIGGDSIISLKVTAEARDQGFLINVNDIFKYKTIRKISKHCWNESKVASTYENILEFCMLSEKDKQLLPRDSVDAYPISSLQLGMLYYTYYLPSSAVYLDVFNYKIKGTYNHNFFVNALQKIINANPILRVTFHLDTYSVPIQIVHKTSLPVINVNDLTTMNESKQKEELKKWMKAQKKQTFDFKKGPLFQVTIHKLSYSIFHIGFSFHHAILDGWSVATFITQLLSIYSDLLNENSAIIDLNEHYREFIKLEKDSVLSENQKNFWEKYLEGFEISNINKWQDFKFDADGFYTHTKVFSKILTKKVIRLSKKINVSIDVILMTAFIKLLSILTNSEEILTGVVFNGRPAMNGIEKTLGLFLNALPFRQKITNSSWKDLILSISNKKEELYPYRHYPLLEILKNLKTKQLFNTLFYFTNFYVYDNITRSNRVKIIDHSFYERTNFPFTFNCSLQESLTLFINYETKYYTHKQIGKISDYFSIILTELVTNVDSNHQTCDVLSPREKQMILSDWNNTEVQDDLNHHLNDLLGIQARKTPYHIALKSNTIQITYQSLITKINFLSSYLRNKGASPGDFIVVYMNRSINHIISILAILKLGCVYVPIDTMQPDQRVEYILDEVNCKFILSNQSVAESANIKFFNKLIVVDDDLLEKESLNQETKFSYSSLKKLDLAYVIYTSGSTGNPKGVMIKHDSLINFLFYMKKKLVLNSKDCFLSLTSFSFDISLLEIFLPLLVGATCVIADHGQNKDPNWIIDAIQRYNITCLQATPTTWQMLFDFGYRLNPNIKVISGGESLTQTLATQLAKNHLAWNMYGPTETTIWSTCFHILKGKNSISPVPIGRPISNTKVYVLDRNLKPVPIGVPGELYISGVGLAKGYLNRNHLTKEKFINNPFNTTSEIYLKMYKTGDLVCWLPDGILYFMGRTDNQFKLRGFRIESGDIESALSKHYAVKKCVVLIKKISGVDCLTAYIVLNDNDKVFSEKKIRSFLLEKLPYYMLPERFAFIDDIPTNINGKIDRKKLFSLNVKEDVFIKQEGAILLSRRQKRVADIWKRVLNVDSVCLNDDFYDLGGNSILALITLQEINNEFSVDLSIHDFVEHPNLSDLSELITQEKKENKNNNIGPPNKSNSVKKIPDPIVTLRKHGEKTPLFLIHPVGGTIFYYIPLVKRLLSNRPVYAIQDPAIETKNKLFSSLGEMVEFYIMSIKKYQPYGPYYIAGSSFGANAAVEMAQQLKNQNEVVSFTGLIDGWAKYPYRANNDKKWFENNLKNQIKEMNVLLPKIHFPDLFLDIHWHRQQLLVQHDLSDNLNLNLTLFKAKETIDVLKPLESPHNNWEKYCSVPPKTYIVPGDHFTMHFEPYVDILAQVFDSCLEEFSH